MASDNERLLDKRIVERNIAKGLLRPAELEQHLAALPDAADNAEYIALDEPDDDDIDDEDDEDEDLD